MNDNRKVWTNFARRIFKLKFFISDVGTSIFVITTIKNIHYTKNNVG